MVISADVMRFLLVACMVGMALLALVYLRRRILAPAEYLAWGLLAVLVPFLGPFLVIYMQPGSARPTLQERKSIWRSKLSRKL